MGIDDVFATTEDCRTASICDFEHDMCSWINSEEDTADWLLQRPGDGDAALGPPVDHSTNGADGKALLLFLKVA